jgi:tetratricopeptide (TPR) repeat protein
MRVRAVRRLPGIGRSLSLAPEQMSAVPIVYARSFKMSTVRQLRGMVLDKLFGGRLAAIALGVLALPALSIAESAEGTLKTFQREDGKSYFAMSLTPPSDVAKSESCDVIILFDTSASQAGPYRDTALAAVEACVAKLKPTDRVQVLAADLEARPITKSFVAADSEELRAALESLRNETPLGSTDMEGVLRAAASRFEQDRESARAIFYIGDGLSTANLVGTDSFRDLVETIKAAKAPVSSYAIGPQRDGRLLAALANQTGGNLYIDEPMVFADAAKEVTEDRAREENLRRGATIGQTMAEWAQATVLFPADVAYPEQLAEAYPKTLPPLRTDRDTIVVGMTSGEINESVNVNANITAGGKPVAIAWSLKPENADDSQAYLAQIVEAARNDDGISLPTVGSAGLAETGRMLEAEVDGLTDLAERAIATGDVQSAQVASQTVLARDPGNVKAQTVQRLVEKQQTEARQVAQVIPPQDAALPAPAATTLENVGEEDLQLVRQPLPPPEDMPIDEGALVPPQGSLTDRFAPEGELLDELEQNRRVFGQMLRREIENTVIDARRIMSGDPDTAIQNLKLALENVERSPQLTPDMRAQLVDKLQIALREAQRQASIKDELDAAREEQIAAAREQRLLNDRLQRNREKERQLVDRFSALIDELRFDEALDVAATLEELDPEGVTPVVAYVSGQLRRNLYLQEVTRAARWQNWFDTLYQVEISSVPFPDDPPIVYPAAPVWEELTNRRKDRYGSMDLKATGEAERRIESALRGPLTANGMDFTDTPLEEVVNLLQEEYGIPIQIDDAALEATGLDPTEPVTVQLHNVSLRSALRLMLKKLQLTYIIQDEVLMITTPEEAESQLVVKVYPVADLVLPIDATLLGGQQGGGIGGGGIGGGGQGGGGFGGGGGGFGGGGGGFGGGGGGPGGGGGGGFFSVPNDEAKAAPKKEAAAAPAPKKAKKVAAIAIDESVSPNDFWNGYFRKQKADAAAVRETARQLMGKKRYDQVIAMNHAALRHGQPQAWMYESLGIAMELDGRSKSEIERAVMSAADFSTSADELMYVAQYLSRLGLERRAMLLYQQVAKVEPLRSEAYALGLRAAERSDDLAGIRWATIGILSQAWPSELAEIELTASRIAKATLQRLASEGKKAEHEAYLKQLQEAVVRDCVVKVSWTGDADVDVAVEEPSGTICSVSEPRTSGGGVKLGDVYATDAKSSEETSEAYVCPKGFAGKYRVRIRRVWGEVAGGKVTVDVYTHMRSGDMQHERQQLELSDKDAMVVFDLKKGRREEPLQATQLAGAVKRQQALSKAVLAQQISGGSDPSALPFRPTDAARAAAFFGRRGAVGFQPIVQTLSDGTSMSLLGVVSADRRYVRVAVAPIFSTIGDVQTFTFAGEAEEVDDTGNGTVP